ncbi:hypothetical protein APA_4103 [Pseudanabaena sp. lw0831]|nr:hypothetical protein APA_4103 [Pseudanabaena sp. lw0831]
MADSFNGNKFSHCNKNCKLFSSDRLFEWVSNQQKSSLFDGLLFCLGDRLNV